MSAEPVPRDRGPLETWFVAALAVALVLRVEYLRELILSPFGRHLLLDAEWYDQAARRLAEGMSYSPGEPYFRPPLYPMFLAAIHKVFGPGLIAPRAVQMLLGLGQVWLCWRIATITHGSRVGKVAACIAATYGMFIYFEGEVLTTALGTLLTTAATLALLESDRRAGEARLGLCFAGGLAIGLAAVTHATAVVLAPIAILWALRGPARHVGAGLVLVGVMIPVGGVTARNARVTGELVPIASQGGINFYIGNNPASDGKSALAPGFAEAGQVIHDDDVYRDSIDVAARTLAERQLGRELTASEVSRFWFGQGIAWFRDRPVDGLVHVLRKTVLFWNGFEISNNRDLRDQARRHTPILRFFLVHFAILLPFALWGLFQRGSARRDRILLVAFLAAYAVGIIAFFVCARYRQPVVPWLIPFGAAGMLAVADRLRRAAAAPKRAALTAGILALLFAVTNGALVTKSGVADVTTETDAPFHRFNLAVLYERQGDLDRAIEEYRAAAATGVADPRVHLNLGNALARTGRPEEARREYREALQIAPDYAPAVHSNLGILAAQSGDWDEAIRRFEECLRLEPGHRQALMGLATTTLAAGRFDEAVVAHRRALAQKAAPEAGLRRGLGVAYLELGLLEDAERESLAALRLASEDVATVLTLARIYADMGKVESSQRMCDRALAIAPGAPAVTSAVEALRVELSPGTDEAPPAGGAPGGSP